MAIKEIIAISNKNCNFLYLLPKVKNQSFLLDSIVIIIHDYYRIVFTVLFQIQGKGSRILRY